MNNTTNIDIIYIYTRAQALADGVLIDVTSTAAEAGIRYPVALSSSLWADINDIPDSKNWQDVAGRLWDVLWMFRQAAQRSELSTLRYTLIMHVGRRTYYAVKAVIASGDNGEPTITLMKTDED